MSDFLNHMKDRFDGVRSEPFVLESRKFTSLHFDHNAVQSMMDVDDPTRLVVNYTQSIMGFTLFNRSPKKIAMIGLGGGSIAKYCHHHLPSTQMLVIDNNPNVIEMRDVFQVPKDGERFQVKLADGAQFFKERQERFDVIIVDGFDKHGQPSQLCTKSFYDSCYDCLEPNGLLMINLLGEYLINHKYQDLVNHSFKNTSVMVLESDYANQVLFACKGDDLKISIEQLMGRAESLANEHTFDINGVAKNFLFHRQIDFANALMRAMS